ncbi:unnamed protein product [Kluyveromyces dobzhanskii CBS 2104]|uniref:WGS project CCBQ000000000 data, contig 00009 n=1 Tax=Kluyveromyces dobzhanskii CBS 2104 TaxID=1427455 RepID=A0A0A8L3C9_9SACH|nr:unnamed protein product [Kluyveromyces dobzhanskii CBS 2104]
MSAPLNVGIVGTGIFARNKHLPTFQQESDKFRPVACFNRTKSKADAFAVTAGIEASKVYADLDHLLDDDNVDVLDVMVPVQFNYATAKKSVEAGKPVILEKPIEANLEQARKLVQLAESTELPVAIAENWLHLESVPVAREKLAKIGPIAAFTYNSTGPFHPSSEYMATTWRQNPEHIGGFLSDGGVHQLALLTTLLGDVGSIAAFSSQLRKQSGTDDIVFSSVKLRDSDVIGTFTYGSAFGATEKSVFLKVFGLNGSVTVTISSGKPTTIKTMIGATGEVEVQEETVEVKEQPFFGVEAEFVNFHEAVTKKDKSLVKGTPRVAFHHLAIVAAFLESSKKNGTAINVEQP